MFITSLILAKAPPVWTMPRVGTRLEKAGQLVVTQCFLFIIGEVRE